MPPSSSSEVFFNDALFVPSLVNAIGDGPLDRRRFWQLAMRVNETEDSYEDAMEDRRDLVFTDGITTVVWRVDSLVDLFRGTVPAPTMEKYPAEYVPLFATIEEQVGVYADVFGDPTDDEMIGVYSNLARLPDANGRSLLHNHMWQACALALGTRPWSRMQLEAVLRRLQRACRSFSTHPGSKNYMAVLRRK